MMCGLGVKVSPEGSRVEGFALYVEALLRCDWVLTNELILDRWNPLMSAQLSGITRRRRKAAGMFP